LLHQFLLRTWDEAQPRIHESLNQEIWETFGEKAFVVGLGPTSYLLIVDEGQSVSAVDAAIEIAQKVEAGLFGGETQKHAIQVFEIADVTSEGIRASLVSSPSNSPSDKVSMPKETPTGEGGHQIVLQDASFQMAPIWDVRRSNILAYRLKAMWCNPDGSVVDEADLAKLFAEKRIELALDLEALQRASREINDVFERDTLASIIIPVHYDIVTSSFREKYFKALTRLGPDAPERVFFEIENAPETIDVEALRLSTAPLRAFYHGVILTVPWSFQLFSDVRELGFFSVGVDIEHDTRSEDDVMRDMDAFVTRASSHPIRTHIVGTHSVSQSVAAVCAGFDFVGGQPVSETLEGWEPDDYMMKPIDLYKSLKR